MKFITILLYCITSFLSSITYAAEPYTAQNQCTEDDKKDILIGGWYLLEPYQFSVITPSGNKITGMDIDIAKNLANLIGVKIKLEEVQWNQHQIDLENGTRDIAFGATYTDKRAQYANFSLPYRFEENSLFTKKKNLKTLEFDNIKEFLAQIRLQNYRLGIVQGFVYADPQINGFIQDDMNSDIIFASQSDSDNMASLLKGEIDGFLADRIVGASLVLSNQVEDKITDIKLNIKTPIHLAFSKKTVPLELIEQFNVAIKDFVMSSDYKNIVKEYIYPVLLLETINAEWFFIVGMLGTISFAISGVSIAAKENSTLFGTFIFAMLPSVGGGILRDIMINRGEVVGIFLTPLYMYCIIGVVIIGFWMVRLFNLYGQPDKDDETIYKFWDNVLVFSDSLGHAAFIVTGVVVVVIEKISPLWLWGPFFAFMTANGGCIVRDLIRKDRIIRCMSDEITSEISLVWGFLFGIFLEYSAHNPTSDKIKLAVVIVVIGAFLTGIITHYLRVSNIHFRPIATEDD
jgi:polar amino acid transport system substrate-binding protein